MTGKPSVAKRRGLLRRLFTYLLRRQEDNHSWPLPGGPGNPETGPPVTFQSGSPCPTCTASCGKLCSASFCRPTPPSTPSDFYPPTTSSPSDPPSPPTATVPAEFLQPTIDSGFNVQCLFECGLDDPTMGTCDQVAASAMLNLDKEFGTGLVSSLLFRFLPFACFSTCLYPRHASSCALLIWRDAYDGQTYSICKETPNLEGKSVRFYIKFSVLDSEVGAECVWSAVDAAQWYSNLRYQCKTCGALADSVSKCTLSIEAVGSCEV